MGFDRFILPNNSGSMSGFFAPSFGKEKSLSSCLSFLEVNRVHPPRRSPSAARKRPTATRTPPKIRRTSGLLMVSPYTNLTEPNAVSNPLPNSSILVGMFAIHGVKFSVSVALFSPPLH